VIKPCLILLHLSIGISAGILNRTWEPITPPDFNLLAFTHGYHCPKCGTQPIDFFVDRLVDAEFWPCFFGEGEVWGILQVIDVLNKAVVHELCHWADCDEEGAWEAEEISHEDTCAELHPSQVLRIAAEEEGVDLDKEVSGRYSCCPECGAYIPPGRTLP